PRAAIRATRPAQRPSLRARMTAPSCDATGLTHSYHRSCHGARSRGSRLGAAHPNVSLCDRRSTLDNQTSDEPTTIRVDQVPETVARIGRQYAAAARSARWVSVWARGANQSRVTSFARAAGNPDSSATRYAANIS